MAKVKYNGIFAEAHHSLPLFVSIDLFATRLSRIYTSLNCFIPNTSQRLRIPGFLSTHSKPDGGHFTVFDLWEGVDFTRDYKANGNWHSSSTNSWNKTHYLDGYAPLVIKWFSRRLPHGWATPHNCPGGLTQTVQAVGYSVVYGWSL